MLEQRLAQLSEMVAPHSRIADIGTDHAYLPIELVRNGQVDFAIASDVAQGPLENAKNDIKQAGLEDKISARLGSGLVTIKPEDKIDTVVIAGMGGKLMRDLLESASQAGNEYPTLILEPNVGEPIVRNWLMNHNYKITEEKIIEVAGHIYELIKAQKTGSLAKLSDQEMQFGPLLIKEKNSVFIKKWQKQLLYQKGLLENLNKATNPSIEKIAQVNNLIKMIEDVIND